VPAGLAIELLAAVLVFNARRIWRRPVQAQAIGTAADATTAQLHGAVETTWLKAAGGRADDAAWPQLTPVVSPRDPKALIASGDFLGANEHALYLTRLFFGRAIPGIADASVVVTEARVLFTDGQQVFAVPRTGLRAISYREKEIMTLRAKREAIVFTYATESGDRELIGFDPGIIFWSGRAAKTHQTFDALRAVLTTGTEPQAAACSGYRGRSADQGGARRQSLEGGRQRRPAGWRRRDADDPRVDEDGNPVDRTEGRTHHQDLRQRRRKRSGRPATGRGRLGGGLLRVGGEERDANDGHAVLAEGAVGDGDALSALPATLLAPAAMLTDQVEHHVGHLAATVSPIARTERNGPLTAE